MEHNGPASAHNSYLNSGAAVTGDAGLCDQRLSATKEGQE